MAGRSEARQSGSVTAWIGGLKPGLAAEDGLGGGGSVRRSTAQRGSRSAERAAWNGGVRHGGQGRAWIAGLVPAPLSAARPSWPGLAFQGAAGQGRAVLARRGLSVRAGLGGAVVAWPGTARPISARPSWLGPPGPARLGWARQPSLDMALKGSARQGVAGAGISPGPRKLCEQPIEYTGTDRVPAGHQDRRGRCAALGLPAELPRAGPGRRVLHAGRLYRLPGVPA